MNNTDAPSQLTPDTAQNIQNFLADRRGRLRGCVRMRNLTFNTALSGPNYGVGFLPQQIVTYTSGPTPSTPAAARLGYCDGTNLSSYVLDSPASGGTLTFPPTFTGPGATIGVLSGLKCRFAAFQTELIAVQNQNNLVNYRMTSAGTWYGLGAFPSDLAVALTDTPQFAASNKSGTVQYFWTLEDNLGRESSPSAILTIAYGAAPAFYARLDFSTTIWPGTSAWVAINLYATTGNGNVFYRIGQVTNHATTTFDDNFTDAQVQTGVQAPTFGQNDQPLPASIIAVHKNRVVLNVNNDANSLQISNSGSATQFSSTGLLTDTTGQVTNPNDGITFEISSDIGNDITGLASQGSLLVIGRQRSTWVLFGDDITDFIPRKISDHGNVSPDAMLHCDNEVIFLSQDGVYAINGAFQVEKISGELDASFYALMASTSGRALMDAAVAYFVQRHYVLNIGTATYVFNVDTRRWVTFSFGIPVTSAVVAMPAGSPQLALVGRGAITTTVNGSANSATQTLISTTGMQAGDTLFFATAAVTRTILSVTSSTVVVLTSSVNATNGETVTKTSGYIGLLDIITEGVATVNMVYQTRLIGAQIPYNLQARIGAQGYRSAQKRLKRCRVFGTGSNIAGTLTATIDGRTQAYTIGMSVPTQQVLCLQEFYYSATGRDIDITLSLSGTGVEIQEILAENVFIG